jgi:peptidoglycan/xylan/chitin deacetylase (PgdA/CDA1 family)
MPPSTSSRPPASLSLDLDNEWSYLKTHGDPTWSQLPSYIDLVVPRFVALLRALDLRITVFIVGQDAALEQHHPALRSIVDAGHEVGNHSFHHEPWLHAYSAQAIDEEIEAAHDAIVTATGQVPRGFRGPGFSVSRLTLETLVRRGYRYDASTLPTYIGPIARAYYFMTARLSPEERERRKALFGGIADGLRPIRPYLWDLGDTSLLEIPVTTFPVLKTPFHFSYVLYMAMKAGRAAALAYFRAALIACRAVGVGPSLLLHPLDFLGCEDVSSLSFFPAMQMPAGAKLALLDQALRMFADSFDVLPMGEHASQLMDSGVRTAVAPQFSGSAATD